MKYRILKNLHNNFSVFEKNKLIPRAYAVPFSSFDGLSSICYKKERYSSDMVTVLSGEWNFRFYKSIKDVPDCLDTAKTRFDTVTVPSDWQRTGYQEPVYLNCPYEIKTIAPQIPEDMPVGVYRKKINIEKLSAKHIISFLGVSNNLSLYVNGKFVGYSEGSHNTAEFDITAFLSEGTNEIVAVMFKWCNGTFLECQDMFRENGIFRDVLLYNYPESYLYDFEAVTEKAEKGYNLTVRTLLGDNKDCKVLARVFDREKTLIAEKEVTGEEEITFEDLQVQEWNAEIPVCYALYLTVVADGKEAMTLRQFIGFKTIRIENGVFYVNDKPIKVKGVNHHDTDLYKGYSMSSEDMERDIRLMKELNVNGVRTSHYPPDPYFITLCDINGLYVIDEADIETHGCGEMFDDMDRISHDIRWAKHYVDRVKRMYFRDRNHPSIIMWSLGNEAGGYKCQDRCYKFLKETGTPVPVHYEGVVRTKRFHYDVISEMYTSTEEIEDMIKGKRIRRYEDKKYLCREYSKYPFYLCEYAHAMGVGPGNLEEYWDLFYKWDNSMGGCIWEWADHAVYHDENDKKYKYKYTYGGDHGEKQHDGHFCVDGLMYADRRLHTGAKAMKVVYRPVRAEYKGDGVFTFTNTNRFRDSSYIAVKYDYQVNGITEKTGDIELRVDAMQSVDITLPEVKIVEGADCYINFIYTDKETGHEIALEQAELSVSDCEYDIEIGSKISAESENGILTVIYDNGKAVFDGTTGELTSYIVNGKELLNLHATEGKGINLNLYRALIDNDARMRDKWAEGGLNKLKKKLEEFWISVDDGEIAVEALYTMNAGRKTMYCWYIRYTISSLGAMEIQTSLKALSPDAVKDIPRFGITLELDRSFCSAEYFGRGTAENMPDFKAQSPVGIYSSKIADMYEPYVFPQENGMHCDTRWLKLSDGENTVSFYGDAPFNFSVHHKTQSAINKAEHQEDLKDMNTTYLTLDGYTRGIGSSSCGPDTREEYRLDASKIMEFSFTIIPTKG
ncbi:MAG: hypothetical protein J6A97_03590 [Clostridia bacterium]|nr:hypothetical protein [Clostridia bacterium]